MEYDEVVGYFEIVGDDKYLFLQLEKLRKMSNSYKKVRQNLLFNDLYALF